MHLRLPPPARPTAAVLVATAALAGCGSSSSGNGVASKPPAQIVTAAQAAADGADTVHVTGTVRSEGKPLSIDMKLVKDKGGQGKITLDGLSINLVRVAGAVYVNGSEAFYARIAGPAAARLLQGKWLKAPEKSGNFASLAALTDLAKLIDTTLASHGKISRDGVKTVNGQKVVAVNDVSQGGTLYVAVTGQPFPIEIVKDGGSGGRITFGQWNQPVELNAPANAINIDQLQKGG